MHSGPLSRVDAGINPDDAFIGAPDIRPYLKET